jgi:fucose 4-O-acetylase-like acetyltransferase
MPASSRIRSVEAVKGIAISLMVYGHVAQGVYHRGWWNSPAYLIQERFIYSFHMAAFFFASGLFVSGSLARQGPGQFVLQRLRTVLWPYLFCVAGYAASLVLGRRGSAGPHNFVHSVLVPALTGEASWFLPTLFLCLMLATLTDLLPAWARFLIAAALNLLWPPTGIRVVDSAARYFVFVAAGEWVGRRIERVEAIPRWAAFAGATVSFLAVAAGNLSPIHDVRIVLILLGLAGTLGLFLLAVALRNTVVDAAAVWCGTASLGIFVLHPFFQGATRAALSLLAPSHAVFPNVLIPTIVAIVLPGLLWHLRDRLHIGFLFAFPWGEPKRVPAAGDRQGAVVAGPAK